MHQVPMSTVSGGQVPASFVGGLAPDAGWRSLTVGIAEAGNLPFLPSSRIAAGVRLGA